MSNVFAFPGHARAPPPPSSSLAEELDAAELRYLRARIAQLEADTRQARALFAWYCLKRVLFWGFVLWLVTSVAKAEPSRSFYDGQGRFAGSSLQRGNQTIFYGNAGQFSGSTIARGKWRNFYDRQGRYIGTSIDRDKRP